MLPSYSSKTLTSTIQYIAEHQGLPSTAVYSGVHRDYGCGEVAVRRACKTLLRDGVIRQEVAPNERGGPFRLIYLCGDTEVE